MKTKLINEIEKDYAKYCLCKLKDIDPSYRYINDERCIFDYHRYKFRKITDVKRKVYINPEFSCPDIYCSVVASIIDDIKHGRSLIKYQSRKLKYTDYDDMLLMDWGIQHLHLGSNVESDGFIERTKELLFVRFTNKSAYILDIFEHQQWSTLRMLEIIHQNWPESIERFKVTGIVDISYCPDEASIMKLRKAGLNYTVKLSDGSYYMGPGGGITAALTPMQVTDKVLYLRRLFRDSFNYISNNFDSICEVVGVDKENHDVITVGLRLEEGKLVYILKEVNKGLVLASN